MVISRTKNGRDYRVHDHNGQFMLNCLDVTLSVTDIYRRLPLPNSGRATGARTGKQIFAWRRWI